MATNSPSDINGSDPTVLRQIERQNTALQTRGISTPPSVSGTSGANTTTTAGAVRNLAPIVSGSETLYPQSTTATSNNAVTINSSINNDTGDVTTVYTTNGRITVNPINQTINQYTSVDSGVSQIVAGNGVTISSTGDSGTGVVTINASTVALGNIVSVNLDGNSANVLHGDGSWSADQTTYGNSNVANYLPTYTGNVGANWVIADYFSGNAHNLTYLPGANVNGFVPNANVANTAFAVAAANVSGLGNVALVNFDGNSSNVLYGNGVFDGVGSPFNQDLNTTDSVTFANITSTEAIRFSNSGNIVGALGYAPNYVSIEGYQSNSVVVTANDVYSWTFGSDGNLTLPANTFSVNYANGTQVSLGGGGNTGDFTFANTTMSTPDEDIMLIQTTDNNSDLRTQMRFNPDFGQARMAARSAENNTNYTNTSWTIGEYTSQQVNFVDAPAIVAFLNTGAWNSGVDKTFSINGGNRLSYQGYSAGGNNATVYTDVSASPDPTTVTSIDFYYQLESKFEIDEDDGDMGIYASGLTINIDNDQTEGPDINIRSGDDILLQAKDMSLGSEREGGDINIYAGDGSDDDGLGNQSSTGGDIQIFSGVGGDGNTGSGSQGGTLRLRAGEGGVSGVTNVAGQGGFVEIWGGDGGPNNGDANLGASGGYVDIQAGDTNLEGTNGGNVSIRSGAGGANAIAGNVEIIIPASGPGGGGTWTFDGNGLLTLPDGAIIDTTGNNFEVRAVENVNLEANAVVNIYTDGSGNAYQWQFGDDGNLTLPTNGSIIVDGGDGVIGPVSDDLVISWDNEEIRLVSVQGSIEMQADAAFRVQTNYDGANVLYASRWEFTNNEIVNISNNFGIVSEAGNLNLSGGRDGVNSGNTTISAVATGVAVNTWTFDNTGNLTLAGGNSVIFSTANSSLDPLNPNVSTMTLTPDANYNSQVLVLDPTAPGHIHLRAHAFSNIDDPAANIFLGGEDTSFEITQGSNNEARIHSGGNTWTFANTGILTVPGEGIIQSINDTVILQSVDANSNVYSARLGTNGGLYFATTQYPLGWLDITNNSGNANITAATGTAGGAGKHIYINAGAADQSDFYTTAGGNINITGGLGAFNDGGGGGPGGSINLIAGNSADPAGVAGSINITTGSSAWTFNNAGQITLPGNQGYIGPSVVGNPDLRIYNDQSSGFVRLGWQPGAVLTPGANVASNVTLNSSGFVVTTTDDSFTTTNDWTFGTDGNLTLPGNTVAINFANGSAAFSNLVQWTTAPVANTSAGTAGQAAYDAGGNLFVCVSTNTWAKFTGTTIW